MKKLILLTALGIANMSEAAFYTVTSTADNTDSVIHGGSGTQGSPYQMSSLRGAILNANTNASTPATIMVPAGTYPLSVNNPASGTFGTISLPDLEIGSHTLRTATIVGTGGRPKIQQTVAGNDVITTGFDSDDATPVAVNLTLDNLEITGGKFTGIFTGVDNATGRANTTITNCFIHDNSNSDATFGQGGAIFNQTGSLTVNNCTFSNNVASNSVRGQGGAIFYNLVNPSGLGATGDLAIANCTFINNKAGIGSGFPAGGGIFIAVVSAGNSIIVSNCTFTSNQATNGGDGGAVAVSDTARVCNIIACTFTRNQVTSAAGHGGAIAGQAGPLNVSYCRFVGNTATTAANGKTIFRNGAALTAIDNWWLLNTGPAANDVVGTVTLTSWLQLRHAANPNTIFIPNSTTLTATFLTNSAGTFIPVGNLSQLLGLPITFNNPVRGTLSGAQTTIQSSGTATATFTANTAGAGSADATVDSGTATASITIPTGVSSINRVNATTNNLNSVQWTVTFTNGVSGVNAGNFSFANGGLGGSPAVSSVVAVGATPATSWTVTASTGSGTGTLGLNMVNGTGVNAVIVNLPFTGQVYTIDLVPPDTSITAQPPGITNSTAASFSFTGSDLGVGVAGFQCRLDGGGYTNCTSPVSFTGLADGSHTFNVRAVDGVGNLDASPAAVTWTVDTIPPTITCPTNLTFSADTGTCSKTNVALGSPTTFDAGGVASVTNNAPTTYPVGTNTVTWVVRDQVGYSNSCNQLVIVKDTEPPRIFCSTNITVNAAGQCPVAVNFSVTATDNCGPANLVVTPGTGASFPVGTNLVNALAQDASANSNTCSFTVTVLAGPPPQLAIARSGTDVVLSWPNAFGCYALQFTPALLSPPASNVWTLHPGPFVTNGGSVFVTNNASLSNRFFRLAY